MISSTHQWQKAKKSFHNKTWSRRPIKDTFLDHNKSPEKYFSTPCGAFFFAKQVTSYFLEARNRLPAPRRFFFVFRQKSDFLFFEVPFLVCWWFLLICWGKPEFRSSLYPGNPEFQTYLLHMIAIPHHRCGGLLHWLSAKQLFRTSRGHTFR